jgi:RHS repeat-associated protein
LGGFAVRHSFDALITRARGRARNAKRTSLLGVLLCLAALASFPLIATGAGNGDEPRGDMRERADGAKGRELVEYRTRRSRTYETSDGAQLTRLYSGSVNYRSGGEWRAIDNTLTPSAMPGYAVENESNRYTARFPSDLATEPVRVEEGDDWISFQLEGARGSGSAVRREVEYGGAFPGVDVGYVADADSVKETMTLASPAARASYRFTLDMSSGLRARETGEGGIEFVDGEAQAQFSFAPPYMLDAAGAKSDAVTMRLDGHTVVLSADREWLDDAQRAYPVVIDPITQVADTNDCYMVGGSQANTTFCGFADNWMTIGRSGGTDNMNPRRGYARFDTSPIPKTAQVIAGDMSFYYGSGTSRTIDVHRLTRDSTSARTWNKYDGTNAWTTPGGDIDATAHPSDGAVGASGAGWYHWFVTELVQNWVDGSTPNHGVILKDNGNQGAGSVLNLAQHEQAGREPYIDVKWKHRVGIQPQYTFDSQPLTDRATLQTNVANGNLLLEENDLKIAGIGLDFGFSRYFNNLDVEGGDGTLGFGWNESTGYDVWVQEYAGGSVVRLDGPSGWNEPFIKRADGSYKGPTGLNATLKKANGQFTVTFDRTQEKFHFPCSGCSIDWHRDRNDNQISFEYLAAGNKMSKITDTRGRATTFTYNGSGYVSTMTDSTGRVWQYGYTGNNLTSYTNPAGKVTQYAYDSNENLTQITDPRGNRTKLTYDAQYRVKTIKRVTGQDAGGNDVGPTTTYTYAMSPGANCPSESFGETVLTDANGHDTTYCYDRELRVTRVKDARGKSRNSTWTSNSDADVLTSAGAQATKFTYDSDNRQTTREQPAGTSGGTGLKETRGYSPTITDKSDPRYQLPTTETDTQQNQLAYGYDGKGNVTSVASQVAGNNQVKVDRRADGQIDAVTEPNDQGSATPTTDLIYSTDGKAHLTTIDRPTPLGDETFTYDALSRPNVLTDGRGQTADYDFDAMDRLTKLTYLGGATVTYVYDENGNLTSRTDNTGTTTYVYDKLNRLSTENFPGGRQNLYTYDAVGKLKTFQDAGGTTTYNYGVSNLLESMQAPGDAAATTFGYDDDNRRTSTAYPGGVTMTATFDNPGRLKEIKALKGGATLTHFEYDYNTVPTSCGVAGTGTETNLRQKVTDKAVSPNKVTTYCYDKLNRLTKATEAPGSTFAYQYDGNGNITRKTKDGGITSYGFNRANQLCWSAPGAQASSACPAVSGATMFGHDGAGNLQNSTAGLFLSYNQKEQTTTMTSLTGGAQVSATYAGPNQFERATFGGITQTTSALGVNVDKNGTDSTYYRRDNDGQLHSVRPPSGPPHYYLFDGLGSVAALSDFNGAKSQSYAYDPYGATTVNTPAGPANPWRYAGTYQDSTGFYKMGMRYYAPTLMRWAQQDPLRAAGDLAQGNRYGYAAGSPTNATDPTGRDVCDSAVGTSFPGSYACGAVEVWKGSVGVVEDVGHAIYPGFKKVAEFLTDPAAQFPDKPKWWRTPRWR